MKKRLLLSLFPLLILMLFSSCADEDIVPINNENVKNNITLADNIKSIIPEILTGQAKVSKITICHLKGNGTYNALEVNSNALAAHLNHYDALPGTCLGNGTGLSSTCEIIDFTSVIDICDGIDNDCDGLIDENACQCIVSEWQPYGACIVPAANVCTGSGIRTSSRTIINLGDGNCPPLERQEACSTTVPPLVNCCPADAFTGDVVDVGVQDAWNGWYDVSGCGSCQAYCRWVGGTGSGGDPSIRTSWLLSQWTCQTAVNAYVGFGGPFVAPRCDNRGDPSTGVEY